VFISLWISSFSANATVKDECEVAEADRNDSWLYGDWAPEVKARYVGFTNKLGTYTRYHYLENRPAADTQKPELVMFLHGFPEISWSWEKELVKLGQEFHVIAPDLKGFYKSDKPDDIAEYDLLHVSSEFVQIAQCLGYDKFHLVGHDWGGGLSWITAHLQKDYLKSLTIMNAPHPIVYSREYYDEASGQKEKSYYIDMIRENNTWTTLKLMMILTQDTSLRDTGFYDGMRFNRLALDSWFGFETWTKMFSYYRAMDYPPPKAEDMPTDFVIEVPTQVLWGTQDKFLGISLTKDMDELVPNHRVILFDQADHWLNHHVDVTPVVREFVLNHINTEQKTQDSDRALTEAIVD